MASTNKTPNYELSQFVETDRPAWLTDYNGDMRKLDTALKAVSDVASGASGGISSLTDRMTAAEGGITTNANDIDALEARADALEAQAQSSAGTIAGIQTEQIAQNAGIESAIQLGYNLARPYDSASTYAAGDYVLFQNTLYKCVTAIATGEAFDPTKWLAIKATDEITAGGYTLPIASASQLGGVKVGSGLNIDPLTGILSTSGNTASYTGKLTLSSPTISLISGSGSLPTIFDFSPDTNLQLSGGLKVFSVHINFTLSGITNGERYALRIETGATYDQEIEAYKPLNGATSYGGYISSTQYPDSCPSIMFARLRNDGFDFRFSFLSKDTTQNFNAYVLIIYT